MRVCQLKGWDEESSEKLVKLQKECKEKNSNSTFDVNGEKYISCVVKLTNRENKPYFLIQKRKYKKRCCESKMAINDDIKNKVLELAKTNRTKIEIAKELNISVYYINKILLTKV